MARQPPHCLFSLQFFIFLLSFVQIDQQFFYFSLLQFSLRFKIFICSKAHGVILPIESQFIREIPASQQAVLYSWCMSKNTHQQNVIYRFKPNNS